MPRGDHVQDGRSSDCRVNGGGFAINAPERLAQSQKGCFRFLSCFSIDLILVVIHFMLIIAACMKT